MWGSARRERRLLFCALDYWQLSHQTCYPADVESVPGRTSTWILVKQFLLAHSLGSKENACMRYIPADGTQLYKKFCATDLDGTKVRGMGRKETSKLAEDDGEVS